MELFLNIGWALVALVLVCQWLKFGKGGKQDRRLSFIALAMLIVILFPVISVSDDLWSIQNPAETDSLQRREHRASCPHAIFPVIAALPALAFTGLDTCFRQFVPIPHLDVLTVDNPALDGIQNRPPPSV